MSPGFTDDGVLPPGIHWATWEEIRRVCGGTPQRERLLLGLHRVLLALKSAGCRTAFVDGSFASTKQVPGDFDGCWDVSGVDPMRLDPVLLNFSNRRLAQKIKFGGEMFPAHAIADQESGDTFFEFFQTDKETGIRKGILAIDLERMEP